MTSVIQKSWQNGKEFDVTAIFNILDLCIYDILNCTSSGNDIDEFSGDDSLTSSAIRIILSKSYLL
jgi:hypothetical protein